MSAFVDEVTISVRAGTGGDGTVGFQRSKDMPRGRPNGGDGGDGGSVVLVAETSVASLSSYLRRRDYRADAGGNGGPNNMHGAEGADVTLPVPVGTIVRDRAGSEVLADLARPEASFVLARGGRGGRGNAALKSRVDRVPNYREQGEPGEEIEVVLELHLVADVGLLGPPNVGKSTLLGAISRAQPKIGDYPFTTLDPNLGVVDRRDDRYVVADLPGLIEGASEGKGLGLRFLRHAERCAVLALMTDLSDVDAVAQLEGVLNEVVTYDADLGRRARVVIGNKIDLPSAKIDAAATWADEHGARFIAISAEDGSNLDELREALAEEVARSKAELGEPQTFAVFRPVVEDRVLVSREDAGFRVRSERVERLVTQTPLTNPQAVRRLQRRLRAMGVEKALVREGATEGDEVRIGEVAFEFIPERLDA
ncbi:MAG: GTPase ObgE [Actinomycetota bacterium]